MKNTKFITQDSLSPRKLQGVLQKVFSTPHFTIDTLFNTPTHWATVYKVTLHKKTLYQTSYQSNEKAYIVRLLDISLTSLEDRQREIELTQTMSNLGIAPKVYFGNASMGAMVMDYIPVQSWEGEIPLSLLRQLAEKLKKLHNVDAAPYLHLGNRKLTELFDRVETVTKSQPNFLNPAQCKPSKFAIFGQALRAYEALTSLLDRYATYTSGNVRVLCHQDLNKTNILWDKTQPWIIDWDIADQCSPYFDLATVINTLNLTPTQEEFLLQQYFCRSLDDFQKAQLYIMKQVSYLRYAITTFGLCTGYKALPVPSGVLPKLKPAFTFPQAEDPSIPKNLSLYMLALAFYTEAQRNMSSPMFKQALHLLNPNFLKEPLYAPIAAFCNY